MSPLRSVQSSSLHSIVMLVVPTVVGVTELGPALGTVGVNT